MDTLPDGRGKPTKPPKETWRDWMPADAPEPEELLTRDELLARVRAEAREDWETVSAEDLRNWQQDGVIPHGIRRWHKGATRTLYPPFMVPLLLALRALQRNRMPLKEIGPRLHAHAKRSGFEPFGRRGARSVAQNAASDAFISSFFPSGFGPVIVDLPDDLREGLVAWAREYERAFGRTVARIEVEVFDERDRSFRVDVDPRTGRSQRVAVAPAPS